MKQKFKDLMEQYGAVAVVIYFAIFFAVWAGFAVAIKFGFKPESTAGGAGVWAAAYLLTKVTQPLRIGATLVLTPFVGRLVQKLRGTPPSPPSGPPSGSEKGSASGPVENSAR